MDINNDTQGVEILVGKVFQDLVFGREIDHRTQEFHTNHENGNSTQPAQNITKIEIPPIVGIFSICGVTIGIFAMIFNLTFILALSRIKEKDKPYYRFTKCLSICDLLGSFTFIVIINFPQGILGSITNIKFAFVRALPYVFRSLPWMFFTGYLLTLTCLAVNQYIAGKCNFPNYIQIGDGLGLHNFGSAWPVCPRSPV